MLFFHFLSVFHPLFAAASSSGITTGEDAGKRSRSA